MHIGIDIESMLLCFMGPFMRVTLLPGGKVCVPPRCEYDIQARYLISH